MLVSSFHAFLGKCFVSKPFYVVLHFFPFFFKMPLYAWLLYL